MNSPTELRPEVRERIVAALATRSSPTRSQHHVRSLVALGLALLPIVATLLLRGVRPAGRPIGYVIFIAAGWSALVVESSRWVLAPGRAPLGRPRPRLLLLAVALPSALLAVSCVASVLFPETLRAPDYAWKVHLVCAGMATGLSLLPIGIVLWSFRGSDPVRPAWTGAALGAIAASWGGAVFAIQCPHAEPLHVALGHVAPIALAALVTALVGSRLLALR